MRMIDSAFDKPCEANRKYFSNLSSRVSLTLDLWTSPNRFSFLGITVHWIDDNWQLHTNLLDFKHLKGSHSGENLAETVFGCLLETNLSE